MRPPRSAGELGKEFPYTLKTVCYIEVTNDGTVGWDDSLGAYERARAGASRLYAVWPGEWASHLFAIDDLDEYARAMGIIHDQERTGLAEHQHQVRWSLNPYERNPSGSYVTIDVSLECGCKILDLKSFATQMRQQKGWEVATSVGWGGSESQYYMRVRRSSLTA